MNFSNNFKLIWWGALLLLLSLISAWRLFINSFTSVDSFIFIFWFILVLFPIINEISFFGISIKKELENVKNEIKGYITEIKNNNNFQPTINVSTTAVDPKEYKEKTLAEMKQIIKSEEESLWETPQHTVENKIGDDIAIPVLTDRLNKIIVVEGLIAKDLEQRYGQNYRPQIRIKDQLSDKSMIIDGAIYDGEEIVEIVEIKFITKKSFERFYFIAFGYLKKMFRFGFRYPVKIRMIVVSEEIDETFAQRLKDEVVKVNFNRSLGNNSPHIDSEVYKLTNGNLSRLL